jgi:hypothetical protein
MLDERWPPDAADLSLALRALLEKEGDAAAVRVAEARPDGRDPSLEEHLKAFGLWELPPDPAILGCAAWELGRALAPVPFAECAAVRAVIGTPDASSGLEGPVPVPPARSVVRDGAGRLRLEVVTSSAQRTASGDLLARVPDVQNGGPEVGGPNEADRLRRMTRLLHAARLGGAGERLLEIGVGYAKRREQFGRPIGSFQAIAHRLADAATALDGAALLVRKAAWVADPAQGGDGAPSQPFATMTWAKAVDAARFIASTVHQVMGGYGFTLEEDCQLYSRRIRSWTMRLPQPAPALAELARALLDPARRDEVRYLWHHDRGVPLPRWAAVVDDA